MTSIKKPLIAIAAAVALATTTFVAAPANAAVGFTLTGGNSATVAGDTTANAIALPVPADNKIDAADVLNIAIAGLEAGTVVSVVATDATLVTTLDAVDAPVTATSGSATAAIATGTGTTANIKVYTKTTKVGKVVITAGTATPVTYYVKGTAGSLNAISVVAPTAALGTVAKATVAGVDVFGNGVSGAAIGLQVIGGTSTANYSLTTGADGTYAKELTGLSVDTYDLIATATVAAAVTGLAAPAGFVKAQLKVVDLTAVIAARDAEIAALKAEIAALKGEAVAAKTASDKALADAKVTADAATAKALADAKVISDKAIADAQAEALANKLKFNNLAKRWNVKFPRAKATLLP